MMPPGGPMAPHDTLEMAVMGLDAAVVAPLLYLATRRRLQWDRWLALPAPVMLVTYCLVHTAITVGMDEAMPPPLPDVGFHVALIVASIGFWLPVIGRRRISDAGRMVYLFLAMPTMDLAGVWVVLRGDASGGLAMIVGMLPIGVWTLIMAWRWMSREEALA